MASAAYFSLHSAEQAAAADAQEPESDRVAKELMVASSLALRTVRDRVTRHRMAEARDAPLDDANRIPPDELETVQGSEEAWAALRFAQNDEFQTHAQRPVTEDRGALPFRRLAEEVDADCREIAVAVVKRHIISVFPKHPISRGAVTGLIPVVSDTSATYVVAGDTIGVHVWRSRREARRFHEALRRTAQAKFEHMVPSPVHVPLAALVAHQGAYVSVVWLPPLVSEKRCEVVNQSSLAFAGVTLLAEALGIDVDDIAPAQGADGRLYMIPQPSAVLRRAAFPVQMEQDTKGVYSRCTTELLTNSTEASGESVAASDDRLATVARLIVAQLQRFELTLPPKTPPATAVEKAAAEGIVAQAAKELGLEKRFLYLILRSPALKVGSTVPALVSGAVATEIFARAIAGIARGVIAAPKVADSAGIDVQHVARIVGLNQVFEPLHTTNVADKRRFLEVQAMPVVRAKFAGVPADTVLPLKDISIPGAMRLVGRKLSIEVDLRGKSFLRFLEVPLFRELSHQTSPAMLALAWSARAAPIVAASPTLVAGLPGYCGTEESALRAVEERATAQIGQSERVLARVLRYCRIVAMVGTRADLQRATDVLKAFFDEHSETLPLPMLVVAHSQLCSIGSNSHVVEDAAVLVVKHLLPLVQRPLMMHGDSEEDHGVASGDGSGSTSVGLITSEADEAFAVETLRVVAARLAAAAPGATGLAGECLAAAKSAFRRVFRFGGFVSSSIYFEMCALEVQATLKTMPIDQVARQDAFLRLEAAAALGADVPQRRERLGELLRTFCANFVRWLDTDPSWDNRRHFPRDPDEIELADRFVRHTTMAVQVLHSTATRGDYGPVFTTALHTIALVAARHSDLTKEESAEALPRSKQLTSVVREGFDAHDDDMREALLATEWTPSALGLLVTTAMGQGQWHAAGYILLVLEDRFTAMHDPSAIGYQNLQKPLRLLQRAHEMTLTISRHYNVYALRNAERSMKGLLAEEALHARGIVEMEGMARTTLLRKCEIDERLHIAASAACDEMDAIRTFLTGAWSHGYLGILVDAEISRRCAIMKDEMEAFEDLFLYGWRLGRHHVSYDFFNALGAEVFEMQWPTRRSIERQEGRAYTAFLGEIETNARRLIFLEEQHEVRILYTNAAEAVLRRIAQSQVLVRAVPTVSLYFFSEEADIRAVIEDEADTMWEEMRLKERLSRMGALRDARMRAAKQPKRFNAVKGGAEVSPRQLASPRSRTSPERSPARMPGSHRPPSPAAADADQQQRPASARGTLKTRSMKDPGSRPATLTATDGDSKSAPSSAARQAKSRPVARTPAPARGPNRRGNDDKHSPRRTGVTPKPTAGAMNAEPPKERRGPLVAASTKEELFNLWQATKAPRKKAPPRLPPLKS